MKYIIGITIYDEWDELWGTKLGLDKSMQQCYTVWGSTKEESIKIATSFVEFLNESLKEYLQNLI